MGLGCASGFIPEALGLGAYDKEETRPGSGVDWGPAEAWRMSLERGLLGVSRQPEMLGDPKLRELVSGTEQPRLGLSEKEHGSGCVCGGGLYYLSDRPGSQDLFVLCPGSPLHY